MKKILSFLLIVAVLFSFSALSASAEGEDVIYVDAKIEGSVCTVSFTPSFNDKPVSALEVYFIPTNFVPSDAVSSVSGGSIAIADYMIFDAAGDGSLYCISAFSMAGNFTGETHTITFDITPSGEASIDFDMESSYGTDNTNMFMLAKAPAVPDEPAVETVKMTATPFFTEVAESKEGNGWQKGQAVALQFNPADLAEFVAMNWKLTVGGVNKFAKVDDAAFATIKAAATNVDVFASFIVNTAENTEATPITAVSAGFKKADGTVVEAE